MRRSPAARTKSDSGSNSSTSAPPSPRANPTSTKSAVSDRKLRFASPDSSAPTTRRPPSTATATSKVWKSCTRLILARDAVVGHPRPSESSRTAPACCAADGEARVVAINLPAGEALDDHQVHERAYLVVVDGEVEVERRGGHRDRRARPGGALRPEGAARGAREGRQPPGPLPGALAGRGSPEPALTQ